MGDPRPHARGARPKSTDLLAGIETRVADELAAADRGGSALTGPVDQRWYWAAPLLLDQRRHPAGIDVLLAADASAHWGDDAGGGLPRAP